MSKNSKAYREAAEKVDRNNLYTPLEAARLAKETSSKKQDATVEVAIRLGVDPRKADQMVRGTVNLPHGTGKTVRVAVFAVGDKAEEAKAAGADIVGSDDLIEKIQGGFLDFDAAIATPDQMAKVGRIARVLGPRGLMPNPKTGTVTPDVAKAVSDIKGGKINFRVDKQANLHFIIGKASFDEKSAGRELRRRAGRDPAGQAVVVEGPLPEEGRRLDDHRPGHPGRPGGHPQLRRGVRPTAARVQLATSSLGRRVTGCTFAAVALLFTTSPWLLLLRRRSLSRRARRGSSTFALWCRTRSSTCATRLRTISSARRCIRPMRGAWCTSRWPRDSPLPPTLCGRPERCSSSGTATVRTTSRSGCTRRCRTPTGWRAPARSRAATRRAARST